MPGKFSAAHRWSGFLPTHSIVMSRRRPPAVDARETPATPPPAREDAAPGTRAPEAPAAAALAQIAAELDGCPRCKLCATRRNVVIGEGNPRAELVFVGEGPGEQEDATGRPFVGRAGELLDRMIGAMGLARADVMILNVVKCRPPGNRNPEPDEVATCSPFLERQIDAIRPRVVVALGKFAAQTLLRTDEPISRMRGRLRPYRGARLMPTFHPAYLLRNPESKREAWADLQAVARELGLAIPRAAGGAAATTLNPNPGAPGAPSETGATD